VYVYICETKKIGSPFMDPKEEKKEGKLTAMDNDE
jgi:hypothetical protein